MIDGHEPLNDRGAVVGAVVMMSIPVGLIRGLSHSSSIN